MKLMLGPQQIFLLRDILGGSFGADEPWRAPVKAKLAEALPKVAKQDSAGKWDCGSGSQRVSLDLTEAEWYAVMEEAAELITDDCYTARGLAACDALAKRVYKALDALTASRAKG